MFIDARRFPSAMHFLQMHSHNKQNTIAIGKTLDSVLDSLKIACVKESDTRAVEYYCGVLINLPPAYHAIVCEKAWQEAVRRAKIDIVCALVEHYKLTGAFPSGTKPCECFSPSIEDDDYHSLFNIDDYGDEVKCAICKDHRFLLDNLTWDDLAPISHPEWNKLIPPKSEDADLPANIYACVSDGWSKGTRILDMSLEENSFERIWQHVHCLFVGSSYELPEECNSIKNALDANRAAKDNIEKRGHDAFRRKQVIATLTKGYKLLGWSNEQIGSAIAKIL
jgi:hypothetical protein